MSEHKSAEPEVKGRWVGESLWWDINGESISDEDLKHWVRTHFPEDSVWASTAGGIVAYHTRAFAHRRTTIAEFMRTQKWLT